MTRAEEDRDALRPSQPHPQARSPAPKRSEWCKGRVPPGRHGPEPPQARQADPDAAARHGRVRSGVTSHRDHTPRPLSLKTDLVNTISAKLSFIVPSAKVCSGSISPFREFDRRIRSTLESRPFLSISEGFLDCVA